MNICGVLIHAAPDRIADVVAALQRIPGSELHGTAERARLIVTIEDTESTSAADGLAAIHRLPGVVSAALVYHYFEPASDEAGTIAMEAEGHVRADPT